MPKQRGETGQFVETVTLEDVLEVFDEVEGPPVVTSGDVADATGVSRDSARRKLEELQERGEVDSRRTAGRVLYWRVDDVRGDPEPRALQEPAREDIAPSGSSSGDGSDGVDVDGERGEEPPEPTRTGVAAPRSLGEVDFPSGRDPEECVDAVLAAREYIRESGPASMADLVTGVMPDHPVGYDAESDVERINDPDARNRSTWWRKVIRPGLKACPDVEAPAGGGEWRYTG